MVWDFPLLMLKRSVLEHFAFDVFFGDIQPAIPNNWTSWMLSFCLLCLVGVVTDEPFSRGHCLLESAVSFSCPAPWQLLKPAGSSPCSPCRFSPTRQVALLSNPDAPNSDSLPWSRSSANTGLR